MTQLSALSIRDNYWHVNDINDDTPKLSLRNGLAFKFQFPGAFRFIA